MATPATTDTMPDDESAVDQRTAGLDRGAWHIMTGTPYLIRLMGFGFTRPKQPVPGTDVSGRVVAVGEDVTRFSVGDDVLGIGSGAFAEYATAPQEQLVAKPAVLGWAEAAALANSGIAALQAVQDIGRVAAGQHVLITGASGGVGSHAVQLAHAAGAAVTAVCSGAKADFVRSLGADHVIDYRTSDLTAGAQRFDVILDIAGRTPVRRLRRVLTPRGTLVIVGGEGGGSLTGGMGRQLGAVLRSLVSRQRLTFFLSLPSTQLLSRLGDEVVAGAVRPAVATYSLAEAPTAMRDLVAGRTRGKAAIVSRNTLVDLPSEPTPATALSVCGHRLSRSTCSRMGPAVLDPDSPRATKAATARSPW